MAKTTFARSLPAACKGAQSLTLVLPVAAATTRGLRGILGADLGTLAARLAKGLEPGPLGRLAGTLAEGDPSRLEVAVLPDRLSRHNSPARGTCIARVLGKSAIREPGVHAVVLVLDEPDHVTAAVSAVARSLPLLSLKTKVRAPASSVRILCVDRKGAALAVGHDVRATAEAIRAAARLVDSPPTDMNPEVLAREARALLREVPGARVRMITGAALLENGLRGIHAVGRTAKKAPRMLVATWSPPRKKGLHVALVGKGVTYDTGGLSLKTGGHMFGMKADMGGAAATLGAFAALARGGCPHRLTLILCLAENAIGPDAYKPDDVLKMHSGRTVEINNTDAEGRILLADGVSWAARKARADVVIDAATLTGAQLVATGVHFAAVVANDAELEEALVRAGRKSGDLVHPLPFAPELFQSEFESELADMRNSVKNRMNAQSSCAAQFVHAHLSGTDVRWGHVDLAGPAFRSDRGTGFGVALLAACVRDL